MPIIYYISHPKVKIDSEVPDQEWEISPEGFKQLDVLLRKDWISDIEIVYSSNEKKTLDAAKVMANKLKVKHVAMDKLGGAYRDRKKIGFLSKEDFNKAADLFYQQPDKHALPGWEKAIDVHKRNIKVLRKIFRDNQGRGNIAIWGHGDAGTLILCCLLRVPISRKYDQDQLGSYFIYDSSSEKVIQHWMPIGSK